MSGLRLDPNIAVPDALFERLVRLHDGLTPERSRIVDARLILILANHIGDHAVLDAAIEAAGRSRTD